MPAALSLVSDWQNATESTRIFAFVALQKMTGHILKVPSYLNGFRIAVFKIFKIIFYL
jgi:hypothetical protein